MTHGPGVDREHDLVDHIQDFGEWCDAMRVGASGGGTADDRADVLATIRGLFFGFELKYTSEEKITVQPDDIKQLQRFGALWGFDVRIIARYSYDTTWYVLKPGTAECKDLVSDGGYLYLPRDERDQLRSLEEMLDEEFGLTFD